MRMRLEGALREYSAARDAIFTAAYASEQAYAAYARVLRMHTDGLTTHDHVERAQEWYGAAHDALYAAITRLLPAMPRMAYRGSR